jgi:hypothetical protein
MPFTVWMRTAATGRSAPASSGTVDTIIGSPCSAPGSSLEGSDNPGRVCQPLLADWPNPTYVDARITATNMLDHPGTPPECLPAGEYTLQLADATAAGTLATCSAAHDGARSPGTVCIDPFCDPARAGHGVTCRSALQLGEAYPNPFNPSDHPRLEPGPHRRMPAWPCTTWRAARWPCSPTGLHAAGAHSSRFDGANLASGVYIATLEAEGRSVQPPNWCCLSKRRSRISIVAPFDPRPPGAGRGFFCPADSTAFDCYPAGTREITGGTPSRSQGEHP